MHKFLSLPLTLVIIKHVTPVTVLVTIEINAPFTNVPLAFDGRLAITPTDAPFIVALSHSRPLTPPQPPSATPLGPLIVPQFPLLPLAALIHHIPGLTNHITGTVPLSLIRTT